MVGESSGEGVPRPRTRGRVIFAALQIREQVNKNSGGCAAETGFHGRCKENARFADHFPDAQHWRSDKHRVDSRQRHPGHSVAIIPVAPYVGTGMVADKRTIIGQVPDCRDQEQVAADLQQITGSGGWFKAG